MPNGRIDGDYLFTLCRHLRGQHCLNFVRDCPEWRPIAAATMSTLVLTAPTFSLTRARLASIAIHALDAAGKIKRATVDQRKHEQGQQHAQHCTANRCAKHGQ
jgi:hypothetical protein